MKLLIAIIQPTKLDAVREALEDIEVARMTVCDAQGFARGRGRTEIEPEDGRPPRLLRKVALEVVVNDDFLDRAVDQISNVARTGSTGFVGDGKIFVMPVADVVQLNDSARGPSSV